MTMKSKTILAQYIQYVIISIQTNKGNNMKLKILSTILLTTLLQGCYPAIKETGVEMLEKCYDGVVYVSNSHAGNSSLSVKFNRDSTVSTTLINGVQCR